jgi:8-oxo-dGTP pyrophosphatase MutT (NUDIX family)
MMSPAPLFHQNNFNRFPKPKSSFFKGYKNPSLPVNEFEKKKEEESTVFGGICVNEKGEVLLVRQRLGKKWSFPKGHREGQETCLECARREVREESGIEVPEMYVSFHTLKAGAYFIFPLVSSNVNLCIKDLKEIDEVKWVPLKDLSSYDTNIDVSIFRTLTKYHLTSSKETLNFLGSNQSQVRVNTIKKNIENARK